MEEANIANGSNCDIIISNSKFTLDFSPERDDV